MFFEEQKLATKQPGRGDILFPLLSPLCPRSLNSANVTMLKVHKKPLPYGEVAGGDASASQSFSATSATHAPTRGWPILES